MNDAIQIELRSEEYGEEYFNYDTIEEAKKAFPRLVIEARRAFKKDHVARTISIIVETALID